MLGKTTGKTKLEAEPEVFDEEIVELTRLQEQAVREAKQASFFGKRFARFKKKAKESVTK